jgi:hypothetical protein
MPVIANQNPSNCSKKRITYWQGVVNAIAVVGEAVDIHRVLVVLVDVESGTTVSSSTTKSSVNS